MPTININGFTCYYDTFGKDQPGKAPVVLIHGSTGTGRSNWRLVAPRLAKEYRVIVPDCRGHGRSTNPHHTYSFKEMAGDTAALVRALGYERAHIIGHSNGGNVALVTLLEYPEIVQTAIPQAANAYVSPDLPEKEPAIFDPDRVAREDPAWMEEMIELHGATHGTDYWRELLQISVKEIITEPNYTSKYLAKVERPTLVIQGENDRVNAPFRHAQFIARYIPYAEKWIPAGVAHNVHDEVFNEWIEKVLDFLSRRGNDASDKMYHLKQERFPDSRVHIFEVRVVSSLGTEKPQIIGRVLSARHHRAALDSLKDLPVNDQIKILIDDKTPWALVKRGVTEPPSASHMAPATSGIM